MYCPYCGTKNNDDANFCQACGTYIRFEAQNVSPSFEHETNDINYYQEIVFTKVKKFVKLTYKQTDTTLKIFSNKIDFYQEISHFFKKTQIIEKEILLYTISTFEIRTVWDCWDSVCVIYCSILGFLYEPVLLPLALIFAFRAYGKEILIKLSDGTTFTIPCSRKKDANKLPFLVPKGKTKLFRI